MNPQTILQERYPAANLVVYNAFMELCRQFEPEPQKGMTQEHHICPRKQFPEYVAAPENLITLRTLLHQHAHKLLAASVPEIQNLAPWIAAGSKPKSVEHLSKIASALKGKKLSEETRRRMSEAARVRHTPLSEETRRKIGEANSGKKLGPLTDEHRRNLSEAMREHRRIKKLA
jgi:hypothetical protein